MTAPLEYMIVGFPENDFSGEIVPELMALVESRVIRIVDLVFITADEDGNALVLEVDEHDHLSAFATLEGDVGGVIGPDDIEHAAESLADASSVLLLVWQDLWAEPLVEALRRAGGELIEGARIPAELADEVTSALAAAN